MYGRLADVVAEKGSAVYVISSSDTVRAAVHEMNNKGVGALLVMDQRHPVGIFTERDVLRRVVDQGWDPGFTPVATVMTSDLSFASPDMSVASAMELMTAKRFRHLPVLDGDRLAGVVSSGDLLRWLTLHQEAIINQLGYPGLRQLG